MSRDPCRRFGGSVREDPPSGGPRTSPKGGSCMCRSNADADADADAPPKTLEVYYYAHNIIE